MSTITQNIFIVNPLVRFHIWFSCKLCLITVYIYQSLQNLNGISQESQLHISRISTAYLQEILVRLPGSVASLVFLLLQYVGEELHHVAHPEV